MKRASIITIIVAAVIILAGVICLAIGASAAKKEGFMLFPQSENGETVYTCDFTGRDINRITADAGSAKVTISRGGERSYIEIKNYNANYYRLNEENRAISFAEIDDVLSMFKFWEGFTFKGMRYFFSSGIDRNEAHEINVNIAEGENVGSVVIRLDSGTLTVSGFEGECDLTLTVGEGTVDASSVSITGSFVSSVSAGKLSVTGLSAVNVNLSSDDAETAVKDVKCEKFTWTGAKRTFAADNVEASDIAATADEASVTLTGASFKTAKIETQSGPVRVDLPQPLSVYAADIATQTGAVFINGEKFDGLQYKTIPEKVTEDTTADTADDADDAGDGADTADTADTSANDGQDEPEKAQTVSVTIHTASGGIDLNTAPEPETTEATDEG